MKEPYSETKDQAMANRRKSYELRVTSYAEGIPSGRVIMEPRFQQLKARVTL